MPPDASAPTIESPAAPVTPAPGAPATPPGPPAWTTDPIYAGVVAKVPSKFIRPTVAETLAAQAESYGELERFKSKGAPDPKPTDGPGEKPATPPVIPAAVTPESTGLEVAVAAASDDEDGVAKLITAAGFAGKETELYQQWEKNGSLTPDQYAAFKKAGRTRAEVDAIAGGMHAAAQTRRAEFARIRTEALSIVGGEDGFKTIAATAAAEMDKAEIARLDEMLKTKDAPIAMARLKVWYEQHTGTAGSGAIERGNGVAHAALPTTMAEFKALTARAMKGDRAAEAAVVAFRKSNSVASLK